MRNSLAYYGICLATIQLSLALSCFRCMGDLKSSCYSISSYTPVVECFDDDEVCYMECARNGTVVKRDCSKDGKESETRKTCTDDMCNHGRVCEPEQEGFITSTTSIGPPAQRPTTELTDFSNETLNATTVDTFWLEWFDAAWQGKSNETT